jgi:hypothetical protein
MTEVSTKFDVFRPELWTPRVTRFFREKLYAANFFKDYSADVQNADIVNIPHFDELNSTVSDISVTTGSVTAVGLGDTKTALTVDAWKGAAVLVTKVAEREIMKRPAVIDEYASYLGYRSGLKVEQAIFENLQYLTASVSNSSHGIYSTNLETSFGILDSNSIPKEECRIFLRPKTYWKDLMSIQKYYDASQFGRATLPFGMHDMLYGVGVTLSNNVYDEAGSGLAQAIVHPGAVAFAMFGPDFSVGRGEDLRKKLISDVMYGDTILNKTWGVKLRSTTYL